MSESLDELFTITCGLCKRERKFNDWKRDLPPDTFKCPACGYTFVRTPSTDKYGNHRILLERRLI